MPVTFLLVDLSSPIFLLNPAEIDGDQVCFRFLISRLVGEIFAVKVDSCPTKSRDLNSNALA